MKKLASKIETNEKNEKNEKRNAARRLSRATAKTLPTVEIAPEPTFEPTPEIIAAPAIVETPTPILEKKPAKKAVKAPPMTGQDKHQAYCAKFALRIAACGTLPDAKVTPSQLPKEPKIAAADVLGLLAKCKAAGIVPGSNNAHAIACALRNGTDLATLKKA